jgi:N-acetylmuramoyl-L-alanine amidase
VGDLFIGGTRFDIDAPMVSWFQSGWDARTERCVPTPGHPESYTGCVGAYGERAKNRGKRRFSTRPRLRQFGDNPKYEAVKGVIRKFVLHHDGCFDAKMCWNVLHNERGLSCHFIINNDGTIFQTLDLGLMGYHAAQNNPDSIGVEFCNRGDAIEWPNYYSKHGLKREITNCKINGHTIRSYDFTKEQYKSFDALARALTKLLPNLPVEFPQDPGAPGKQSWGTLDGGASMGYAGYIGHYHLTNQKWDPGPFDLQAFCKRLRGQFCFPVHTKLDVKAATAAGAPLIPGNTDDLEQMAKELYAANEDQADGGFYPVGPWGESRLWHGGIHVVATEGQPVFSPFPGRIVAARMGGDSAVGSNNFVLVRHDLSLGDQPVRFWSLYMHLADELTAAANVPLWMTKDGGKNKPQPNTVALLDEPIEAAQLIGHVGSAGPEQLRRGQLHLEVFSLEPLFTKVAASPWELVDGTSGGRFCDADEVLKLIDTDSDGKLSTKELSAFYRGGRGAQFRTIMTYNVSEWTTEPDWHDALRSTADYRTIKAKELDAMVDEQIVPGLWWTDDLAMHAGLPSGGEVVHYHPVKFLHWFNEKFLEAAALGDDTPIDDKQAVATKDAGLTDDFGDVEGEHAMSASDDDDDRCDKAIDLKDMVQGFDAPAPPGCGP